MTSIEKQSTAIKGGARPGAGRKKGIPNKKTAELQKAVEESGLTPLDYLLEVMRDTSIEMAKRLNAAVAAAPYIHARLSSVDVNAKVDGTVLHGLIKIPAKNA